MTVTRGARARPARVPMPTRQDSRLLAGLPSGEIAAGFGRQLVSAAAGSGIMRIASAIAADAMNHRERLSFAAHITLASVQLDAAGLDHKNTA